MQSDQQFTNPSLPASSEANAGLNSSIFDAQEEPQMTAERLCQMAEQMQAFLTQQVDRLEHELANSQADSPEQQEYQRLFDEFQEVRRKWETEREEEQERLMQESQRLVEAWKKLECEQRETLKQRVLKSAGADAGATGQVPNGALAPQRLPSQQAVVVGSDSRSPTSRNGQIPFQQLRREMMEHARQRRKR